MQRKNKHDIISANNYTRTFQRYTTLKMCPFTFHCSFYMLLEVSSLSVHNFTHHCYLIYVRAFASQYYDNIKGDL